MSTVTSQFTCTSANDAGTAVVSPVGDIDVDTVDELWSHLAYHLEPSALVVLNCSGITSCDAAGVYVMERADETAHEVGALFVLACVGEPLSKLLTLAGLAGRFAIMPTVADAVDPLHHEIHGDSRQC